MKSVNRYIQEAIVEELKQTGKMVFISAPRQVGKTTDERGRERTSG